jgi:hypothetical protein
MQRITSFLAISPIKMETLILAGVLNLALLLPLQGRIGDDPKACAARYGVAIEVSPDGGFIWYRKDGIKVACNFTEGLCSAISYSMINTQFVIQCELGKEPRFTKEQVDRILNLNRGDATWSQESKDSHGEKEDGIYKTSDGKLHALVYSYAVNIESIASRQAYLAKINPAAVDKTLTSFESGIGDDLSSVIRNMPDVPQPPDPLEESIKQLEKSNKERQENMELQYSAASDAIASLDLIAKRVQKRQEMRDMLVRLEALKAEVAATKDPDVLKSLRAKEAALTAEMIQVNKEYELLDVEYKRFKPIEALPLVK